MFVLFIFQKHFCMFLFYLIVKNAKKNLNTCCLCLFLLCSPTKGILNFFYVRCSFRYPALSLWNRKSSQTQPVSQSRRYHSSIYLTPSDSDFFSGESEMGDILHIILWGMLNNLDEVSLGFRPANPVAFDIKSSTLNALKNSSGKDWEDCKAYITHFLEACGTIKSPNFSKSYNRLRLFRYSLTGYTKYWLKQLPSGTIAT